MLAICISSEKFDSKIFVLPQEVICRPHGFQRGTLRVGDCAFRQPHVSLAWCCSSRWEWCPTGPMSHLPALHGCSWCGETALGTGPLVEVGQGAGFHFPLPALPEVTVQEAENTYVHSEGPEKLKLAHHARLTLGSLSPDQG